MGKFLSCGTCQECCTALLVVEMNAPAGQPCVHQGPGGCGIYTSPDRPHVCGAFACMWARDAPGVPYRPDDCGVLIWRDAPGAITLRELRPGAIDESWVEMAVRRWEFDNEVTIERLDLPALD